MSSWVERRHRMVEEQLVRRGIQDSRVLEPLKEIPRHLLLPEEKQLQAYEDRPLGIGQGQTISQPYIVALMTEKLEVEAGSRVLEVGTGSGYQALLLAKMGATVYSIERLPELAQRARAQLDGLGGTEIQIRVGDGSLGWPEEAPFDRILVSASCKVIPEPLLSQLGDGGRMILPVGEQIKQELTLVERKEGQVQTQVLCGCLFVPLIGLAAWKEEEVEAQEESDD